MKYFNSFNKVKSDYWRKFSNYIQGQEPEKGVREYFYFIDHQGMVRINKLISKQIEISCFQMMPE